MVAFEVFAKVGDQEFPAGELIEKPIGYTDMVSHEVPTMGQDHFTLILRSSRDLARRTYGVDAIWHGEITLGPIPIVLRKTRE